MDVGETNGYTACYVLVSSCARENNVIVTCKIMSFCVDFCNFIKCDFCNLIIECDFPLV